MTVFDAVARRVRSVTAVCTVLFATQVVAETTGYADASDADLQALTATWDTLSGDQRRALLTEIHHRMIAAGKKPVLRIRSERRFGYSVPQPDGTVVQIERREEIVRYRELDPSRPFGVGFEQRRRSPSGPVAVTDVTAADAPRPGSPQALADAAEADAVESSAVPRAAGAPVYQLPIRQVRASESPR